MCFTDTLLNIITARHRLKLHEQLNNLINKSSRHIPDQISTPTEQQGILKAKVSCVIISQIDLIEFEQPLLNTCTNSFENADVKEVNKRPLLLVNSLHEPKGCRFITLLIRFRRTYEAFALYYGNFTRTLHNKDS